MIDLEELSEVALYTAEKRMKNGANIKTDTFAMLKHCATEVIEVTEVYTKSQWQLNKNEMEIELEYFASELADVIMCCLIIAGKEGIDIEEALLKVAEKNKARADGKGDKK